MEPPTAPRTYRVMSRREVEGMIFEGHTIVVIDQHVLKLDSWLKYHPGGEKAIMHFVGRDATDEARCFHCAETQLQMNKFRIGKVEGRWANFVPPIQGGKFRPIFEVGDDGDEGEAEGAFRGTQDTAPSSRSSISSRASSLMFDVQEQHPRRRGGDAGSPRSHSTSSTSTVDEDEADPMAHLDAITREKITLDLDKYPLLDETTQDAITSKYRLLDERIRAEGLYDTPYLCYLGDISRCVFLFALMLLCVRYGWYAAGGIFLGCTWHQLVFPVHDAGHIGITHNFHTDSIIGILIADFIGGLSIRWWKENHNVHHLVTNAPEHDPDIQHMPHLAVSHRFLGGLRSTYYEHIMKYDALAKASLSVQAWLYYPLLALGRFNLYRLSWEFLLMGRGPKSGPAWWHRYLEIVGQVFFWAWFGYGIVYRSIPTGWDRFVFVMISHMITCPLHVQFTVSHFAMSTADLGPDESFPQKMLRTTMDVDCPPWLDFFHGGLQFQAIHHLFPRVSRYNLRKAQKYVQEFCDEVGIPYALYGFVRGNQLVIGRLAEVSRQAAILAKCQRTIAAEGGGVFHDHHH